MWRDMSKCGETSTRVHMNSNDKIKKVVNMMKQVTMIRKLSVSHCLGPVRT